MRKKMTLEVRKGVPSTVLWETEAFAMTSLLRLAEEVAGTGVLGGRGRHLNGCCGWQGTLQQLTQQRNEDTAHSGV